MPTYNGTNKSDTISGSSADDLIFGYEGNDTLVGGGGDDYLDGGDGNDTLDGGAGANRLLGGNGDDTFIVNSRFDVVLDSGGDDTAIINVDFYPGSLLGIENIAFNEGVQKFPYWIDALTFPSALSKATDILVLGEVLFGFPDQEIDRTSSDEGFAPLPESHRDFIRQLFSQISSVIGVTFVETKSLDLMGDASTILFSGALLESGVGGDGGDRVRVNTFGESIPSVSLLMGLYVHEIGHVLGLKHPFGTPDARNTVGIGPYLPDAEDDTGFTVMSYTGTPGSDYLPRDFSPLDRAALQYLYGVSPAARTSDTVHGLTNLGPNFIWDGDGIDTINGAGQDQDIVLNLKPGYRGFIDKQNDLITGNGQIIINFGTEIENAQGGSGNDLITGNALPNELWGNAGDDILEGEQGNDSLWGGLGFDTARYVGQKSDYDISARFDGVVIVQDLNTADGDNGTDQLRNVERLEFSAGGFYDLETAELPLSLPESHIVSVTANEDGKTIKLANGGATLSTQVQLYGTAAPNTSVLILDGDKPVGAATSSALGEWAISLNVLSAFDYEWTVRSVDALGNIGPSAAVWALSIYRIAQVSGTDIRGTYENELFNGTSLDEYINGDRGRDILIGGEGDDVLNGGDGNDILDGGDGNDNLNGGFGDNHIEGGSGNDYIYVSEYDAALQQSTLGNGLNFLSGGEGDDQLDGGSGNDILNGGAGKDFLRGNAGKDILNGGAGNDLLNGGEGIDIAVFSASTVDNSIRVVNSNRIIIGGPDGEQDVLDDIERIQFDDKFLAFDLDGNAGKAAKLLAVLVGGEVISNAGLIGVAISYLDNGTTYEELMKIGLDFVLGADATADAVVSHLFANLPGAESSSLNRDAFIESIDSGFMTAAQFGVQAADTNWNESNIDLVGLAQSGLEYLVV